MLLTISWGLPFLIPISWLITLVQLAKMTLNRSTGSLALYGATLPLIWAFLGALIMGGIPGVLFYLAVIYFSFH